MNTALTLPPITYRSTRGQSPEASFDDIVLTGLAPDGGLYVPSHLPQFNPSELARMASLPYTELAKRIIAPFVGDAVASDTLKQLIDESYSTFRHHAVTPLVQLGHQEFVLELFHGQTLAFKDVALQLLGRIMDTVLKRDKQKLVILGATSGDTGSAAIAGCQGREQMDIVILYPKGRVSDVQRRQMTTVTDTNVHCLAVNGTFDDCQHIVKTLFVDQGFRSECPMGAVNSINWARIVAQIVYYFYAAFQLGALARSVCFSVPTGNFGDIYAGYLAKRMGLPMQPLIIASNSNDILTRCYHTGRYEVQTVEHTISPSMDIGVSSNFERLLYDLHQGNTGDVAELMTSLKETGSFTLSSSAQSAFKQSFIAHRADDAQTSATMKRTYQESGYLLDPHTAIGVHAVQQMPKHPDTAYITLATAHPAKFPDAVRHATHMHPELPQHLADLHDRVERFTEINNDVEAVKEYLRDM